MNSDPPSEDRPQTHWVNPWREAVPVPLTRLAEVCAGPDRNAEQTLEHWRQYGKHLDAYALPNQIAPDHFSVGVRYGSRPEAYLSPYAHRPALARTLIEEYGA